MKQEIIELAKQAGFYQDTPMYYDEEMLCKFFRLAYARGMLKQEEQSRHWSDCAVHSEPAYPAGECDCGGYTLEKDAQILLKEIAHIVRTSHLYGSEMKKLLDKEELLRKAIEEKNND